MIPLERLEERMRLAGDRERVRVIAEAGVEAAIERAIQPDATVNVFVWEPRDEDWRSLKLAERRALWGFRDDD